MKVIFVRHGESAGNADIPSFNLAQIPLTHKGETQAEGVAAGWRSTPTLIVMSPYLRAQMTAQPTIRRFLTVPLQVLCIQEFVYLDPAIWGGSTHAQRRPAVEAYWGRGNPDYVSGPGAESFHSLLERVRDAFRWFDRLDNLSLVYAFSHGQFMQAARLIIARPSENDITLMQAFADYHDTHPIENGETMAFTRQPGEEWRLDQARAMEGRASNLSNFSTRQQQQIEPL